MLGEKIDKALILLKFVHRIRDVLNKNPDFIQSTKGLDYSYYIKVVDEIGDEVSKFTIGLRNGFVEIKPTFKPDVIMVLSEDSFFGIIRGKETLEEAYFSGNADIFTQDGNWSTHLPGLKNTFDSIQQAVRKEIGDL